MQKWIKAIVLDHWKVLTAIIGLQITYTLLSVLQPIYYQRIISLAISKDPVAMIETGLRVVLLLVCLYFGCALVQAISGFFSCSFSSHLLERLQIEFFEKTSHLPLVYFQNEPPGEMFTKFNNDVGQAQRFFSHSVPMLIREAGTSLVIAVIIISFCPIPLAVMTICIVSGTAVLVVRFNRKMARYAAVQREKWGFINKVFDETLEGIDTFKMFTDEARRKAMFKRRTVSFRKLSVQAGRLVAVFSPGIDLLMKLGGLFLIFLAYRLISNQRLHVDGFLLFFFYSALLQGSMKQFVGVISAVQPELTGVHNLSGFFANIQSEKKKEKAKKTITEPVSIEIKGLTFAYPGTCPLYQDADIFIPARAVTVLLGPSGSGKSTLINILLRFYPPSSGTILLGGDTIDTFSIQAIRRGIGVVSQHHFIFNESIRENLLLANPKATDKAIRQAMDRAQLSVLFDRMEKGLDEVLDPRGKGLSAGEKQRLCIARLLLKKAPVMILDEPWSNIDMDSREKLAQVINTCKETTTILILTHDIHPTLAVDRQYVLNPSKRRCLLMSVSSPEKNLKQSYS